MSDLGVASSAPDSRPIVDWDRMPALARVFVVLAILAVAVRTLWALLVHAATSDGGGPFLTPLDVGDLLILFPALIVIRRRKAVTDTPWVVRGAIGLATFTIVSGVLESLLFPEARFERLFIPSSAQLIESLITAVGWILVGYGLSRLNPPHPRPVAAGMSNLAGGVLLLIAVVVALDSLVSIATTTFVRLDMGSSLVATAAAVVPLLAFGYVARCVARGLDDPNRPERATRLATAAVLLLGLGQLVGEALSLFERLTGFRGFPNDVFQGIGSTWDIALVLLIVAFALGLADPLRPMPKDWEAAAATSGPTPG